MKTKIRKSISIFSICCLMIFFIAGCGDQNDMKDTLGDIMQPQDQAPQGNETKGEINPAAGAETPETTVSAEIPEPGEIVMSGRWGDEITYTLDSNGILTVSGKGKMRRVEGEEYPDDDQIVYLVVEDGITHISSFQSHKKLVNVILGEGVGELQNDAFSGCNNLVSVTLPSSIYRMGMRAFNNTGITEIKLPEEMRYIDNSFGFSALKSIKWPKGVDTIYTGTFYNCSDLTSVYLPKDVVSIREGAFQGSSELKNIYYEGTEEEFQQIEIGEKNDEFLNATVHYNEY